MNPIMKKEYDFPQGVRGKFYKDNVRLNLPVYLEPETFKFVKSIADRKHTDLTTIVNELLKNNMQLSQVIK